MDVQITLRVDVNIDDINKVAENIFSAVGRVIDNANFAISSPPSIGGKLNELTYFEAIQYRKETAVIKAFKFPNDLDKVQPKQ